MKTLEPHQRQKIQEKVIQFYRHQPWPNRLYQNIKLRICPLIDLEPLFPQEGVILDLGCGQGLFALILHFGSSPRKIIGFDLDEKKIEAAKRLMGNLESLSFFHKNIITDNYPPVEAVALIDVLYLIPYSEHLNLFQKIYECLSPDGVFILKEMDTRPRWKYLWSLVQETLAVKLIGFTLGSHFYFRSQREITQLLTQVGFKTNIIPLDQGYPYPHIAYLATKKP